MGYDVKLGGLVNPPNTSLDTEEQLVAEEAQQQTGINGSTGRGCLVDGHVKRCCHEGEIQTTQQAACDSEGIANGTV